MHKRLKPAGRSGIGLSYRKQGRNYDAELSPNAEKAAMDDAINLKSPMARTAIATIGENFAGFVAMESGITQS
jgi:hypothetical protein